MMVEHIHSTVQEKAKGSEGLRKGLRNGDLKKMAAQFNTPYMRVSAIVRGRHFGEKEIVECAERLCAFYKEIQIEETVNQIIESYEPINKN